MFNEELKRRFIEEREMEITLADKYLLNQFNKVEKMEIELNKDLYDFTKYEIIEYYKMLNVSSVSSLATLNSQFSYYAKWCLQQNLVKDNQNHFLEINFSDLNECTNKALLKIKIIDRKTIISWIDMLMNPRDMFIILALFEGIRGKEFCELAQLKPEDVVGNTVKLCTGRSIQVSNKLLDIIKDCIDVDVYYGTTGRSFPMNNNGYVIKNYCNTENAEGSFQAGRRIYNSIKRTLTLIDKNNIIIPGNIFESGKIDMIKTRSKELGMSATEYIQSEYINEVEEKYDCKIVSSYYLKKYEGYLD